MILKNKNLIKIGFLVLVLVIGTLPFFAHALYQTIVRGLLTVINGVAYGIAWLGGLLIKFGALIINLTIDLNEQLLNSPLVQAGFNISLSVANLGFVLLIIVIAIATILRAQTYAAKELLWKLILIAFLVNFSLAIAGIFIDFSGVLTRFFVNASSPTNLNDFADNLVNVFKPQKLSIPTDNPEALEFIKGLGADIMGQISGLINIIFVTVFTIMTSIVMIGTGALFLIRYIYLALLLILMPIAWMLWVFPAFQDQWKAWWNKFMQWTFFMPAAAFFLYLTILTMNTMGSEIAKKANLADEKYLIGNTLMFASPASTIMQMIVALGLLVGGLIAAQGMGIAGANVALGAAKAAGLATAKFAGKIATKPAAWGAGWATNKLLAKGGMADRLSTNLAKLPLGIGRGASTSLANLVASRSKVAEERQKGFTNLSKEALIAQAKGPFLSNIDKAAYANELAKKGALSEKDLGKDKYEDLVKAAGDMGATKDVLTSRPDAAAIINPTKRREEVIAQAVSKISDPSKIHAEALTGEVLSAMNPNQIANLSARANRTQRLTIQTFIEKTEAAARAVREKKAEATPRLADYQKTVKALKRKPSIHVQAAPMPEEK
jgi:hypothetical protein